MSDVNKLKNILIADLIDRIENGETKVTDNGEIVVVKAPAQVLSVAAKVAKDFANDGDAAGVPTAKDLSATLARYRERTKHLDA